MQLVWPELLIGLSIPLCSMGITFGFALWLFGWRWHRFWIVLGSTLIAGFLGLKIAEDHQVHPLVCALVCSVVAGLLSLALMRVVAFVVGGGVTLLLAQAWLPAWDQPIISFIAGGLLGVVLLRLWVSALTSLVGTFLMVHATLCLLEHLQKIKAEPWATGHMLQLNWITIGVATAGLIVQLVIERRSSIRQRLADKKGKDKEKEKKDSSPKKPWWTMGFPVYRQAG